MVSKQWSRRRFQCIPARCAGFKYNVELRPAFWNKSKIFIRHVEDLWSVTSRLNLIIGLRDYDNLSKEEATKAITTTWHLDLILIIS
jgi:hypothetical protein